LYAKRDPLLAENRSLRDDNVKQKVAG
jgi:hypothetical protein